VFEDGLPKPSDYRKFEIKGVAGQDDFASMEEVLRRRFARLAAEGAEPPTRSATKRPKRFAYPPALIVVDGGRGQLSVAERVLSDHELQIPAVGLAKRLEEVYLPGQPEPLVIPRGSEALFVLQHIRDEAHRFAVTYHRAKRAKRALHSVLDDIPGVGEVRKKALMNRFGSVARLRQASAEEIRGTPGVGPAMARTIYDRLHSPEPVEAGARGSRAG
jgi:excinuclease ABC subunit C